MKARLGKAEGVVAVAPKLARIVFTMIITKSEYSEENAFKVTPSDQAERLKNLQKQAASLRLQSVPVQ